MRRTCIIKTGSTFPEVAASKGDFEQWVVARMGTGSAGALVVDVTQGARLPDYDALSGVIITGSHAMVTQCQAWSERTAAWLRGAVERRIPLLGICYGHQLLAYALGGEVGDNPNGREFGTVVLHLNGHAARDELLGGFPPTIRVHVSHIPSVLRLPQGAQRLAASELEPNQAFVFGGCAWGVQFHPEFDAQVTAAYVHHSRRELLAEGKDPERLLAGCIDTPVGPQLLRRFAAIVGAANCAGCTPPASGARFAEAVGQ